MRSATVSQGFEQSSWRLTCSDLVARPPRERERESASAGASEHASERANERALLSSTGEVVCERDTVAAAAVGLAPDVKFRCSKAQLYFTF